MLKEVLASVVISAVLECNRQKPVPKKVDGIYCIKIQNQVLKINPQTGGRITSLELDGKDFFTGKDVNATYWGSTLWPSPQKEWNGVLPSELDNQPYSVQVEDNVIRMVSSKDARFGYVFIKEISGDTKSKSFRIKYTIINRSSQSRKVAPWEVTRVHTKGIALFPKGNGEKWGNMANLAEDKDGITWFSYEEDKIPVNHNKFFADGSEGWVAQINANVVFIKKFPDIPSDKAAPSESEVSIYTNPGKSYVEIEEQGAYQELQPGDSLTWEVNWFLRRIPTNIEVEVGSPTLVSYVRNILCDR